MCRFLHSAALEDLKESRDSASGLQIRVDSLEFSSDRLVEEKEELVADRDAVLNERQAALEGTQVKRFGPYPLPILRTGPTHQSKIKLACFPIRHA